MADVDVEIEKGRMRLTLNRPEKRNALSFEVQRLLSEALWDADNDRDVHSVILRGAGQDFCAGYDLAGAAPRDPDRNQRGASSIDDDIWQLERQQRFRMAIFDMHKPVIAQLHGRCLSASPRSGVTPQSDVALSLRSTMGETITPDGRQHYRQGSPGHWARDEVSP
jgi:enoyl-CoA hydratase/carnithine racemase